MIFILAVSIMGLVGLVLGSGLALASQRFKVEVDPRYELVLNALPGQNCGACGYPGCSGLAQAIIEGKAGPDACPPGGQSVARKIAEIIGEEVEEAEPLVAAVHCQGGNGLAADRGIYDGIRDCRAAELVSGGNKSCQYGCLGLGTCAEVCPFEAIVMGPDNLPIILEDNCTACGLCVSACPRDIISLVPRSQKVILGCVNRDRGKKVKDVCQVGCTACTLCANPKVTPGGAIRMEGTLPVIDAGKVEDWSDLDQAVARCPMHCFYLRD